jgi:Flp pilus assembly protein TadG
MSKNGFSRLWASEDGFSAVELGFIAPILLMLLLGVLDFGMAFWEQMQIANAADAGAQWAMSNTFNESTITNIVTDATNLSGAIRVDPAPIQLCGCATGSSVTYGYGSIGNCTSCPDGTTAQTYIVVNTRICYATLFKWPALSYCSSSDSSCSGCNSGQVALTAQSVVLQ